MEKPRSISIFIPTRKGSERSKEKNTRHFAGVEGGLLYLKIREVLQIPGVEEIVLSTNDPSSKKVAAMFADSRLKIVDRPDELGRSETKVSDLINYVPGCVSGNHIFWIHVTAPFVTASDYHQALNIYFDNLKNGQFDSLLSVTKIQQFIWDNESRRMINFNTDGGNWPRTQDLKPLYEVNHAFYINSRDNYIKFNNRVSPDMDIFVLDGIKSFDIDWEEDFMIAEAIYDRLFKI